MKNQTTSIILTVVLIVATIYAVMFMNPEPKKKGFYSMNQITKTTTNKIVVKKSSASGYNVVNENISSKTGNDLVTSKNSSVSVTNQPQTSAGDLSSGSVLEISIPTVTKQTATQIQPMGFGVSNVRYISTHKDATNPEIGSKSLLNVKSAQIAISNQQGSKLATKTATAGKTTSTNLSANNSPKKVDGDPGDPGHTSNLPVGDGVWILLMFSGLFLLSKKVIFQKV